MGPTARKNAAKKAYNLQQFLGHQSIITQSEFLSNITGQIMEDWDRASH